jgi:hypothetical protein
MATLDPKIVVDKDVLERLVDSRLQEAKALSERGCFAGCVYLAGIAVECCLKAAICQTLDCDGLPATFKSHDLDALLLHSGLKRRMKREAPDVHDSFVKIQGFWTMKGKESIRYIDPGNYGSDDAEAFLSWVTDATRGVVPWLKRQI